MQCKMMISMDEMELPSHHYECLLESTKHTDTLNNNKVCLWTIGRAKTVSCRGACVYLVHCHEQEMIKNQLRQYQLFLPWNWLYCELHIDFFSYHKSDKYSYFLFYYLFLSQPYLPLQNETCNVCKHVVFPVLIRYVRLALLPHLTGWLTCKHTKR